MPPMPSARGKGPPVSISAGQSAASLHVESCIACVLQIRSTAVHPYPEVHSSETFIEQKENINNIFALLFKSSNLYTSS